MNKLYVCLISTSFVTFTCCMEFHNTTNAIDIWKKNFEEEYLNNSTPKHYRCSQDNSMSFDSEYREDSAQLICPYSKKKFKESKGYRRHVHNYHEKSVQRAVHIWHRKKQRLQCTTCAFILPCNQPIDAHCEIYSPLRKKRKTDFVGNKMSIAFVLNKDDRAIL